MLQKIPGYDFTIEYRQGKTMTLADTLSRLPNPKDKGAVELRPLLSVLNPKEEFDLCPFAKIGNTIVFCLQFCEMRIRKRKTECDYFLKETKLML